MTVDHTDTTSPPPPPVPTSPTLTPFRHHPPQTANPPNQPTQRRSFRTSSSSSSDDSMIRITIQTPNADQGDSTRRKEGWPIQSSTTVLDLKEMLGRGELDGLGIWRTEGMRLIWQGRIVRDDEVIGDVIGQSRESGSVHSFYLVARPIRPSRSSSRSSPTRTRATAPQSVEPATTSTRVTTPMSSRTHQALIDCTHFVLFLTRQHLCNLLGYPPLNWEDTVPPPLYSQEKAKQAVMSVIKDLAAEYSTREEGWEGWENVFIDVESIFQLDADRQETGSDGVDAEIRGLWASRVGRDWKDGDEGESVVIELDDAQYQLHLPPLHLISSSTKAHLLLYLRATTLLPHLQSHFHTSSLPTPTPTQTIPQPANPQVRIIYSRTFRLRIPNIPGPVLAQAVFSLAKMIGIIWMLTRDMKWGDIRFWVIAGSAMGWWFADVTSAWRGVINRQRLARLAAGAGAGNPPNAPGGEGIPIPSEGGDAGPNGRGRPGVDAPLHYQAARQATFNARYQALRRSNNAFDYLIPLYHLDIDNTQLLLPGSTTDRVPHLPGPIAHGNPPETDASLLAQMGQPPRRQPARWKTQLLLPILLWVYTLIPEWESRRARAIRKRERAMRILIGEYTQSLEQAAEDATSPDSDISMATATTTEHGTPVPTPTTAASAATATTAGTGTGGETDPFPGEFLGMLNPAARLYYMRVLERGEGIDWEEEREAQRALGVGEEDGGGGGGGFRML